MSKIILYVFTVLLLMILMVLAPFFFGIKIDKLNYDNFTFNGLYLKYDKSLIVSVDKLSISYDNGSKSQDMSFSFSVEPFFDSYYLDIENFVLEDPHLKFSGKVFLEDYDAQTFKYARFHINDFSFLWDIKLKRLKAQKAFIDFKNNSFYFSFEKPKYVDLEVEGSYASITDIIKDPMLNMHFYSKDRLRPELLELLKHYRINLPVVQKYGQNDVYTKVIVPLTISKLEEEGEEVYCDIKVQEGKFDIFDYPVYVKKSHIKFEDNILYINGKARKTTLEDDKYKLEYDANVNFSLNFTNNKGSGEYLINDFKYRKIDLDSTYGKFTTDFEKDVDIDFTLRDKTKFTIDDKLFTVENGFSRYTKNDVYTHLEGGSKDIPVKFVINDHFNLKTSVSKGKADIEYKDKKIPFSFKELSYRVDYDEDLKIEAGLKEQGISLDEHRFYFKDIKGVFFNNILSLESKADYNYGDLSLKSRKLNIDFDLTDKKLKIDNDTLDMDIKGENLRLSAVKGAYENNKLSLTAEVKNESYDVEAFTQGVVNFKDKKIKGDVFLNRFNKKNYEDNLKFLIDYKDDMKLEIPELKLLYENKDDTHNIKINNIEKLSAFNPDIKNYKDKKGLIDILTKDFKEYSVRSKNICFDVTPLSEAPQEKESSLKINIASSSGCIKYKDFNFHYDTLRTKLSPDSLDSLIKKGKTEIKFLKNEEGIDISSKYIESSYVNALLGKELLQDGYLDFFVKGKDNDFNGNVGFVETTVKNIGILNSLILFINTTPAIINPLLSIPSLVRFTQTGFNLNGYPINKGYINFEFDKNMNLLKLHDIYTKGKMNDFKGSLLVNLDTRVLLGQVNVIFLKDYADLIKLLPFVDKVILGEDKEFDKAVIIKGTLDEPQFDLLN